MLSDVRVTRKRADVQSAIWCWFDFVERELVDVDELARRLDVQLHVVEKIRTAGNETHDCPLLRGWRSGLRAYGIGDAGRSDELKWLHSGCSLAAGFPANRLHSRNDIRVGSAAADVPAKRLFHVAVFRPQGSCSIAAADIICPLVQYPH